MMGPVGVEQDPEYNVEPEIYREVAGFLLKEAELLDTRKFEMWLDLLTDDVEYLIPVRATQAGDNPDDEFIDMYHVEDNRFILEQRIARLGTEYSWAEQPPSRTRHFITNVRVTDGENDDELKVVSNLLLYVSEGDDPGHKLLSGRREDVLRRVDGELKLAHRTVKLDNSTLPLDRISIFI